MSKACTMHGRFEKCVQKYDRKKPDKNKPLGRLGVDGRITLRWTLGR